MPKGIWSAIVPPYLVGIALSFLLELLLQPRIKLIRRRSLTAMIIHAGTVTLLFSVELLLFWRPWFAMANVMALLFFLIMVSNAKFQALREPFIYQDFEYFTDAVKHPRLYIPFFGIGRIILSTAMIAGVLISGMMLEPPLDLEILAAGLALLLLSGSVAVWLGISFQQPVSCEPIEDIARLGLLASLWCYGRDERKNRNTDANVNSIYQLAAACRPGVVLPDLIAVQSESFFDPRRFFAGIRPEVLERFDQLKAVASSFGALNVPAWGANTVRTEFAFLSGLDSKKLGIHRFNPYRWFAKQMVPGMAGFLKLHGYRTVCIHPYPASFYRRDSVYPLLGFDEFIDIRSFKGAEHAGPYIGDAAVAAKVEQLLADHRLRADGSPIFIFVITMENHGPLHLEQVDSADVARYHSDAPPRGCEELTVYLRHLANADRMIGTIRTTLEHSDREGWLCFFGDHIPIMTPVYQMLGFPAGDSEYVIWGNRNRAGQVHEDTSADRLGEKLLKQAGLLTCADGVGHV